MYLPNPSTSIRMWHKVNFKRNTADFNSEFIFSQTGDLEEPNLSYYLPRVGGWGEEIDPWLSQGY